MEEGNAIQEYIAIFILRCMKISAFIRYSQKSEEPASSSATF